jgi:hypothetical protein
MGLRQVWLRVAARIGVDAFLDLWAIVDQAECAIPSGSLRIDMPRFSRYLRYQRNRLIETWVERGMSREQIRAAIRDELREDLSQRHIDRIIARARRRVESRHG